MKITGDVPTPLTSIESACDELLDLVPHSILSVTEMKTMPFPEVCPSLVTSTDSPADVGEAEEIVSESEERELGEFLAAAAQWL